ncbi:MAG TPA: CbiX/SirB N-terminal domain-containing protein [Gemmatimonadaceae bacterium]|nr:CbiX/SirB N-terminal domain-containing protein [Gemmatimonadaceae bacterium]
MKAILIIDHGSVRDEANRMLECVGTLVQAMAGPTVLVRVAHMELAAPSIAEGFAACVEGGATDVIAFPYMLSPGKHSTRDIPRMVSEAAARYPGVRFRVTSAFGVSDKLAEVILERADVAVACPAPAGECGCTRPAGAPHDYCGAGCRARGDDATTPELTRVSADADREGDERR